MSADIQQAHIVCPKCGAKMSIVVERYVSVAKSPEKKQELLTGALGAHRCACGFVGIASIPMIYRDPEQGLCVYVCEGDRETLIEEFHQLLDALRVTIGESEYSEILKRRFQIVVGLEQLARIVNALEGGGFCYRSSPGLSEVPIFDAGFFLLAAKYYRLDNRRDAAYAIVRVPFEFGYRDAHFLRELGAYAFSAGHLEDAETHVLSAVRRADELSHVWEQVVVPEGTLTKIADGVALRTLAKSIKPKYEAMRPECNLSNLQLARLGGTIIAIFEHTVAELGPAPELQLYRGFVQHRIEELLRSDRNSDHSLEEVVKDSRAFVLQRMTAEDWPKQGLT